MSGQTSQAADDAIRREVEGHRFDLISLRGPSLGERATPRIWYDLDGALVDPGAVTRGKGRWSVDRIARIRFRDGSIREVRVRATGADAYVQSLLVDAPLR
ncbi:MAG: hypothetical protein ABMB14_06925 [Myxococcota bacterium]